MSEAMVTQRGLVVPLVADDLQRPPRGMRKLALFSAVLLAGLPVVLAFTPWRQNIAARGRVVAFDPLDREQRIPAPVTGRLVKLHVLEGTRVVKDQLLAELADLDPNYQARLENQVRFAEDKVKAAEESFDFYSRQLESLSTSRGMEITVARFEFDMAQQKVQAAEQALHAARAELTQKSADADRQRQMFERRIGSELDAQKAEAAFLSAQAKVAAEEAKLREAKSEAGAKEAGIAKVENQTQAKLDSTQSSREEARSKVAAAEKDLEDARSKSERQRTQMVRAPRDGVILHIHAAGQADLVKAGEPLIDFVPTTDRMAAELWVRGNDAPLVAPGSPVRLNFEGWPAVQFVGWPSVAQGTFGGIVALVDAHDDGQGRFRILVEPDPNDVPWPDQPYLRQGGQVKGWVLLQEVSLGYEFWRQLNGFPPSLDAPPKAGTGKK